MYIPSAIHGKKCLLVLNEWCRNSLKESILLTYDLFEKVITNSYLISSYSKEYFMWESNLIIEAFSVKIGLLIMAQFKKLYSIKI